MINLNLLAPETPTLTREIVLTGTETSFAIPKGEVVRVSSEGGKTFARFGDTAVAETDNNYDFWVLDGGTVDIKIPKDIQGTRTLRLISSQGATATVGVYGYY